ADHIDMTTLNPSAHCSTMRENYRRYDMPYRLVPPVLAMHEAARMRAPIPTRFSSAEMMEGSSDLTKLPLRQILRMAEDMLDLGEKLPVASVPRWVFASDAYSEQADELPDIIVNIPVAQGQEHVTLPRTL